MREALNRWSEEKITVKAENGEKMKCSKRICPMQQNISDDCDIKDCPYRTEDVDPQEVIRSWCNYIADLVVQKIKAESEE